MKKSGCPLLSGLFYNGLFFEARPVPAMALIMQFAALNSITDLATKPDRSVKPTGRSMRPGI